MVLVGRMDQLWGRPRAAVLWCRCARTHQIAGRSGLAARSIRALIPNRTPPDALPDTLHRFCKKEHDWGWKKFMELSKVLEGFTVQDTLVIKAQVQVIR